MVSPVFGVRRETVVGLACARETVGFVYGSRAKMGSSHHLALGTAWPWQLLCPDDDVLEVLRPKGASTL